MTGDNHSIRSGRSLQSSASLAQKHPELTAPGLNSSIIETVSARFEDGQLTSSSLIGEIALVYNSAGAGPSQETIRLENFANLEKVAPNPAFVVPSSGEGEYLLNLGNITRTAVAFKYQVRGESAQAQTPLQLAPAFKIEQTQTMVIVSYQLHPSFFSASGSTSITFRNVRVALTLEGARATSCQSKPVGTFNRERNLIFWELPEITLTRGGEPNKLLAKFITEAPASGGHIEGKWSIDGEDANGVGSGLAVSVHDATSGSDPFADESAAGSSWKTVPTQKKLTSGSYVVAKS